MTRQHNSKQVVDRMAAAATPHFRTRRQEWPKPTPCAEPPPVLNEWPGWARAARKMKIDSDKGVGDTIERLLGAAGTRFKALFAMVTGGKDCGCSSRKVRLNKAYPYPRS